MRKVNIPMLTALVLLLATLLSAHFTCGLYARYTATATGNATARVAQFSIESELDYVSLAIPEGTNPTLELGGDADTHSVQMPFFIESRSEVAASYGVTVDFGTAAPDYLTVTLSDGTVTTALQADGTKDTFQFDDFGTLSVFTGGDSDPAERAALTLTLSVADTDAIQSAVEIPTAALLVTVKQID